jgi:hypothetical protein
MRSNLIIFFLCLSVAFSALPQLKDGDILFQNINTSFGSGVGQSTGSEWAHVGIYFTDPEKGPSIIEATYPQGVIISSLEHFVKSCKNRVAVARFSIEQKILSDALKRAKTHLGKEYDRYFEEGNNKLYCSELVMDAINTAANKPLLPSNPMDFTGAWDYWKKYFKNHPIPQGKPGISPQDIFASPHLEVIYHYKDDLLQIQNFNRLYERPSTL